MVTLENEFLVINAKNEGAELISIFLKKDKIEYLWQGDPNYWRFHAPICFPIIGSLIKDTCFVDDKPYKMTVHGFARDMNFDIYKQEKDSVSFILRSNDETLKKYPCKFSLIISYKLVGNKLTVFYEVRNEDNKDIYFSIGAHTAFNCPVKPELNFEDYYLSFKEKQKIEPYLLSSGFLSDKKKVLFEKTDRIDVSKELFENDVIVLENLKNKEITLGTDKNDHKVTVSFEDFPYFATWTKPTGAPFICIEPWFGLPDSAGLSVELKNKKGIQKLKNKGIFTCNYKITII
ncbi:aldose 1-epimerase family protein [Clostridium frigoris]|uniref:Aldose 1-epimerase family protein n=1 Tax=Clostridium frigoris TaxID=205327 RepID=A0ABS6BVQ0_9CLOT|nr:aldose 1-epimerase family protein [Clostridium frigoris]MBU3161000.1 aldose 1-epimerase family protein [Clostridium frigoris]